MGDYNSGLPIRSEADGADEKVIIKIVDGTNGGSNQASVDSDKNLHIESHGNKPDDSDVVLKLSERGYSNGDGIYDATNNTIPQSSGLIAFTRASSPALSDQGKKVTAITNSTVHALDISLHDELGAAFSDTNPLPVKISESEGTIVQNYKDASAVAPGDSDSHDYTVTLLKTLILTGIDASASGKAKFDLKVETGVATGIFTTYNTMFNSTANPNVSMRFGDALQVAAGVKVRVTITNRDNQSQDLYSTIIGHEI